MNLTPFSNLEIAIDNFRVLQSTCEADLANLTILPDGHLSAQRKWSGWIGRMVCSRRPVYPYRLLRVVRQTFETLKDLPEMIRKPNKQPAAPEQRAKLYQWFTEIKSSEDARFGKVRWYDRFQMALQSAGIDPEHVSLTDDLTDAQVKRMLNPRDRFSELPADVLQNLFDYLDLSEVEKFAQEREEAPIWKEYCAWHWQSAWPHPGVDVDPFQELIEKLPPQEQEGVWRALVRSRLQGTEPWTSTTVDIRWKAPDDALEFKSQCQLLNGRVITGSEDGVLRVWSAAGQLIKQIAPPQGCRDAGRIIPLAQGAFAAKYEKFDRGRDLIAILELDIWVKYPWGIWVMYSTEGEQISPQIPSRTGPILLPNGHVAIAPLAIVPFAIAGGVEIRDANGKLLVTCLLSEWFRDITSLPDGSVAALSSEDIVVIREGQDEHLWESYLGQPRPFTAIINSIENIAGLADGRIAIYQVRGFQDAFIDLWNPRDRTWFGPIDLKQKNFARIQSLTNDYFAGINSEAVFTWSADGVARSIYRSKTPMLSANLQIQDGNLEQFDDSNQFKHVFHPDVDRLRIAANQQPRL